MQDWRGHIAVVTGGASGLGAATSEALVALGLRVALFDVNETAGAAQAARIDGLFCPVDVSDAASVASGFDTVQARLGTPRIHINCAGIGPAAKTISRGAPHDPDMFARTLRINLLGSFICASQAAARMAASDPIGPDAARGVIVHTASIAAFEGQIGQVAYAASKGGIVAMTLPMARDLADKGIRVCAIAPGLFQTPLLDDLPADVQASLGAQVPYPPRLGQPDEFAATVAHIVQNPMLNGEVIRLDGAIRMAPR